MVHIFTWENEVVGGSSFGTSTTTNTSQPKIELFKFIRSGRVVDEYGEIMDVEEFIQMALDWGKEDGWDLKSYYNQNPDSRRVWANEDHENVR